MVFKWLLLPAALGAAGYFLIGPEIGQSELATKFSKRLGIPLPPRTEKSGEEEPKDKARKDPARTGPQPEVEVSAERIERPTRKRKRRPRRRRRSTSRETRAMNFVLPTDQRSA